MWKKKKASGCVLTLKYYPEPYSPQDKLSEARCCSTTKKKGKNPSSLSELGPNSKPFSDQNLLFVNRMSFIDSAHNPFPFTSLVQENFFWVDIPPWHSEMLCYEFYWKMRVWETEWERERGTVGSLLVRTTSSTASESSRSSRLSSCLQEWNSASTVHPHNKGRASPPRMETFRHLCQSYKRW